MAARSVRFRLTVWYAVVLAAGLTCFGGAIWWLMKHSLESDLDRDLAARVRSAESFVREEEADSKINLNEELAEYSHALPSNTYLELRDVARARVLFRSPGSSLGPVRVRSESFIVNRRVWRVQIETSLAAIDNLLAHLRLVLIMLSPIVIGIACAGGYWLGGRALRPVDEMTAAARSISIENLSARLPVPTARDELQRLAETWNQMLARLQNAVDRLSRFTADAAHELRTPLSVIRTTAEIAARKPRPAETYRAALIEIAVQSERTARLVDDLLFLARSDAQVFKLYGEVDLRGLAQEVCAELAPVGDAKGVRVHARWAPGDATLAGEELAIRRLIRALLDNAIRYSAAGGEVWVRVIDREGEIELVVEDNGPGIPESDLPFIFDRFYRSADARASGDGGSGLGLSLAEGIAQRHNAAIEVSSAPGHGSIFRVRFKRMTGAQSTAVPA